MQLKFIFYPLLPLLAVIFFLPVKINNTCKSYIGYLNIFFSKDCYYRPDLEDSVQGLIQRYVGDSEFHEVETEDGYILGLFRIPRSNPKGVVLLDDHVSSDSRIWVSQKENSIAFLFWRAGYDIWMSNSRGTYFSKKHKTFSKENPDFWNHSFHEMGYYDNHAVTEFIRSRTNRSKIINLGFSLGATRSLVYASTRPEEAAESLEMIIAIAPVTHWKKASSNVQYLLSFFFKLQSFFNFSFYDSVAPYDGWYLYLLRGIYKICPFKKIVAYVGSIIFGWNPDGLDPELVSVVLENLRLDVSQKTIFHFFDIFKSGESFRMYDYGDEKNFILYGSRRPPLYPVEKIKVPVYIMYGQKDTLSYSEDIDDLFKSFSKEARIYGKCQFRDFNHMDFLYSKHRKIVYQKILQLLECRRKFLSCKNCSTH